MTQRKEFFDPTSLKDNILILQGYEDMCAIENERKVYFYIHNLPQETFLDCFVWQYLIVNPLCGFSSEFSSFAEGFYEILVVKKLKFCRSGFLSINFWKFGKLMDFVSWAEISEFLKLVRTQNFLFWSTLSTYFWSIFDIRISSIHKKPWLVSPSANFN